MIDVGRVRPGDVGKMERVVVAVDPPAGVGGSACGIVCVGQRAGVIYVLEDASVRGLRPAGLGARWRPPSVTARA